MKKASGLKEEEMLRVARIVAVQSAAAAYVETEHDTQLSIERGIIWLIQMVEFGLNMTAARFDKSIVADSIEHNQYQLTRESQAAITNLNDTAIICNHQEQLVRSAAIGTEAGPLWYQSQSPVRMTFPIPYPFAGQNIYLGFDSAHISALTVTARILYTVRTVSDKYFFRVAQSLLS